MGVALPIVDDEGSNFFYSTESQSVAAQHDAMRATTDGARPKEVRFRGSGAVDVPSILTAGKVQKAEKGKINYSARTISGSAAEVVMVSVAKHAAEVIRRDG